MMSHLHRLLPALLGALVLGAAAAPAATADAPDARPRNVMLFISDGASWGSWRMASFYEHGELGRQPYDAFSVKLGMTTVPLNTSNTPTHDATPQVGYDPLLAWSLRPVDGATGGRPSHFEGYDYLRLNATDSAAAATALASGHKTYNNAVNHDNFGRALAYATLQAKALGKATGVLSSVPFSHATPAAFGARNASRHRYAEISEAMVDNTALDVLMGGGHPWYDSNGRRRDKPDHTYMSAPAWAAVQGENPRRTLIERREDFEALADGRLKPALPLLGLPQVHDTLQAGRSAALADADPAMPSGVAFNAGVPTLTTMTRGALQLLGGHAKGFFMMVEGGAVDWAAHGNDSARLIEEQMDFNHAVQAAVHWVGAHGGWDDTLVIVLTDHGNGLPLGPESDRVAFQPVRNHGRGVLPGVRWHTGSHTNENTLLWAHGAGAAALYAEVIGTDRGLVDVVGHNADGRYLANTGVARVLMRMR